MNQSLLAAIIWLLPSVGESQVAAQLGPRGEVTELPRGQGRLFHRHRGVAGSSRAGRAISSTNERLSRQRFGSRRAGNVTTYAVTLPWRRRQGTDERAGDNCRRRGDLQYEIVPEQDVMTETVMLRGLMPAATHGGRQLRCGR